MSISLTVADDHNDFQKLEERKKNEKAAKKNWEETSEKMTHIFLICTTKIAYNKNKDEKNWNTPPEEDSNSNNKHHN